MRENNQSSAPAPAAPARAAAHQPVAGRGFVIAVAALLAAVVVREWLLALTTSFWVDESLIVWTIRDGLSRIPGRAFVSLQSIGFCMVEWAVAHLPGSPELVLRLPSVLAGLATLWVFYRIGKEAVDGETGLLLMALYVATPSVAPMVPNARPYALGMLAHAAGLLWLLRWLRRGSVSAAGAWLLCSVLAVYLHHLFAVPLALEWCYAVLRRGKTPAATRAPMMLAPVAAGLALSPVLPQMLVMLREGRLLSFFPRPDWTMLMVATVPPLLALATLLSLGILIATGTRPRWSRPGDPDAPALGALLLAVPVAGFFAVSRFGGSGLFAPRYLTISVAGGVLLWGWLVAGWRPPQVRQFCILALLVIVNVALAAQTGRLFGPSTRPTEDWRAAVRELPAGGYRLVYPGLVETRRLDWLREPLRRSYFLAPVTAYWPQMDNANSYIVPFDFTAAAQTYLAPVVMSIAARHQPVAVIAYRNFSGDAWLGWISREFQDAGLIPVRRVDRGDITVAIFEPAEPVSATVYIP